MLLSETLPRSGGRQPFETLAALAFALLVLMVVWSVFDARSIEGIPVWNKPAKFALSFVVHFGTLALIVSGMSDAGRRSRAVRWSALIMSAAFCFELGYMILQAAQAERSHFNASSGFHIAMYRAMGAAAVVLIVLPVVVARAAFTDRESALGIATRTGILAGAWVSFALTLALAGFMSVGSGHFVGTPSETAATLPFFGWSAEVGDLRPAHFLALHAFQVLPLFGYWLDRARLPATRVHLAAVAWVVLTLAVFVQAQMGLPLIRL